MSALACLPQPLYHVCSHNYSNIHCCLQDYAFVLSDVLVDLLARPAVLVNSDQYVTGYSHCYLQSVLAHLPQGLLYELMKIPAAQHCWRYFGQHLFPTCTQLFVCMARDLMCTSDRGELLPVSCPRLEPSVHMLGDCHMQACLRGSPVTLVVSFTFCIIQRRLSWPSRRHDMHRLVAVCLQV